MEGAGEIGLREGMRGETASIEGHSRDDMGTQCSGNLLKHMKVRFILKHLNVHCKWGFLCWLSSQHVCYCDRKTADFLRAAFVSGCFDESAYQSKGFLVE